MAQTRSENWPPLPYSEWRDTAATLHLWLQIVGKIALVQRPWVNHSWHVALRITARGIGTGLIPHEAGSFQIDFDFIEHSLAAARQSTGERSACRLQPQPTAEFYRDVMSSLSDAGRAGDDPHDAERAARSDSASTRMRRIAAYDAEYANRYWRVLVQTQRVFEEFRARFIGKCSPVHFFWGSADLAVTRFSGRTAPPHPGGVPHLPDWVAREAYSHEVSSAGFWAGGEQYPEACFYSYAYPEPPGFAAARVGPSRRSLQRCAARVRAAVRGGAPCAHHLNRQCWSSCRAPTKRPPSSGSGSGKRWSSSADP